MPIAVSIGTYLVVDQVFVMRFVCFWGPQLPSLVLQMTSWPFAVSAGRGESPPGKTTPTERGWTVDSRIWSHDIGALCHSHSCDCTHFVLRLCWIPYMSRVVCLQQLISTRCADVASDCSSVGLIRVLGRQAVLQVACLHVQAWKGWWICRSHGDVWENSYCFTWLPFSGKTLKGCFPVLFWQVGGIRAHPSDQWLIEVQLLPMCFWYFFRSVISYQLSEETSLLTV